MNHSIKSKRLKKTYQIYNLLQFSADVLFIHENVKPIKIASKTFIVFVFINFCYKKRQKLGLSSALKRFRALELKSLTL